MLVADPAAKISPLADIEPSVRDSRVVVAAGAVIDAFVKVKPAGGTGDVVIGPGSVINSGCVLYTGNGIAIGADVLIAANCTLAPTNHEFRDPGRPIRTQGFMESRGGITIEDDVWIGANCVILDGAVIRKGSIVAAGSVVRDERPAYSISAGAPAKTIGWRK
jgi:acetyltransferase-like isoleucine patch superfamily enzyme